MDGDGPHQVDLADFTPFGVHPPDGPIGDGEHPDRMLGGILFRHNGIGYMPATRGDPPPPPPAPTYNRAALISTLVAHRRIDEPGLPIEPGCFCGWLATARSAHSWADHVAVMYETTATRWQPTEQAF